VRPLEDLDAHPVVGALGVGGARAGAERHVAAVGGVALEDRRFRDRAEFTAMRPDGTVLDRAVLRHDGWEDMRRDASPAAPPTTPHATNPEAPASPWFDFETLVKISPLFALVSVLAWMARRRAERK
jgi:hypothetical protein